MNILVLGNAEDAHAAHIKQALTQAGVTVDYLNTALFPSQLQMFWRPDTQMGGLILPGERRLNFTDIKSVYWRQLSGVYIPDLQDFEQRSIAINDSMSTLRSLMQACPCRWVNSWQAYEYHKEKPLQLRAVKQLGVNIPATLIANDAKEITEFAQSLEKVIFKPVYGGAHTQLVTEAHLDPKRLNLALKIAPVTLQEYIAGTNIRTYVIGDAVYSAEIRSPALDFREDMEAELIPIQIPASVQQQSLAITKTLKLEWTAIDWRLKPTGEYIFLEANPSPMFLYFEKQTGFPITEKLLNLLMK